MDEDVWMQGDLEIIINGMKPYAEGDIVDVEGLLASLESDGEHFIFSCSCGMPECSGWTTGIKVLHQGGVIRWIDENHGKTWHFDKNKMEEDLKTVHQEVKTFKEYFNQKDIRYVGVGYHW
jgi:hypothetical protein